jgi:hypothetical protein
MGDTIENNSMCFEDIRNKNTNSIRKHDGINDNSLQNDESNGQNKLSNYKDHLETSKVLCCMIRKTVKTASFS